MHRRPGRDRRQREFYVVVEGEVTERDYLALLYLEYGEQHRFVIHPITRRHDLKPLEVVQRAEDLRRAGLHRRTQQGIDWTAEGALAVVFSGGYVDDAWSEDDPWYTGEGGQDAPGGRQVRDQELTGGNLALTRSYREGLPVRVIRKVPAGRDYEYQYEGLFHVVDTRYGPSRDGPRVYRFQLRRAVR